MARGVDVLLVSTQVHMLFKVATTARDDLGEQKIRELMLVRFYCHSNSEDRHIDLGLRHLEWEVISYSSGRRAKRHPHYAVVECSSVVRQACICPHFTLWDESQTDHFVVNDLLDLWPPAEQLPQGPYRMADPEHQRIHVRR